jgi:hypothetical protein
VLDWIDNPTRYEDTAPVPQVTIDVPSREVDPDLERAQSVSDLLFVVKNILRHGARVIDECPEIEGYPYYPELLREYQRNPIRLRRRVSRLNDKHAMKQELQDAEQLVINSDGTEKD